MAAQGDHVDSARILIFHRAPIDEVTVVSVLLCRVMSFDLLSCSYSSNYPQVIL
jgi:hypothetical protein